MARPSPTPPRPRTRFLLSRGHRRRGALAVAICGLVVFAAAPQRWFPSGGNRELHWAAWQQVLGSSYVIFAALVRTVGCLRSVDTRYILDP